jgi:hypothetical protein
MEIIELILGIGWYVASIILLIGTIQIAYKEYKKV